MWGSSLLLRGDEATPQWGKKNVATLGSPSHSAAVSGSLLGSGTPSHVKRQQWEPVSPSGTTEGPKLCLLLLGPHCFLLE